MCCTFAVVSFPRRVISLSYPRLRTLKKKSHFPRDPVQIYRRKREPTYLSITSDRITDKERQFGWRLEKERASALSGRQIGSGFDPADIAPPLVDNANRSLSGRIGFVRADPSKTVRRAHLESPSREHAFSHDRFYDEF